MIPDASRLLHIFMRIAHRGFKIFFFLLFLLCHAPHLDQFNLKCEVGIIETI